MKNFLIIVLLVLIIIIGFIVVFDNDSTQSRFATKENTVEGENAKTTNINTVLTLDDKIQNDTIWCGTFQLIWNDLKNDLAKQDIIFNPQIDVVSNLNNETFSVKDISEEYYYKKMGNPTLELKKEIKRGIKEKFGETSKILDDFDWEGNSPKDYFLYVMLKKEFQFEKAFEKLKNGTFGADYENVKYFGIEKNYDELKKQVEVLFYNSSEDFAIKLKTKQGDVVILNKNPKGETFGEIFDNIKQNYKDYSGENSINKDEIVMIPTMKLNEKKEIEEVEKKPFSFSNGDIYEISKALQTIEFELDNEGGRIKSEAGEMLALKAREITEEKREFAINDTFAIFLIEDKKEVPYFAGKINDITKFQE